MIPHSPGVGVAERGVEPGVELSEQMVQLRERGWTQAPRSERRRIVIIHHGRAREGEAVSVAQVT